MHGLRSLHPTPYKGIPPLMVRRYVGVIAIGNALGNSIVRAGQSGSSSSGGGDKAGKASFSGQSSADPFNDVSRSVNERVNAGTNSAIERALLNTDNGIQLELLDRKASGLVNGAVNLGTEETVLAATAGLQESLPGNVKLPVQTVADITSFSNSAAGVALATNSLNQANANRARQTGLTNRFNNQMQNLGSGVSAAFDAGAIRGTVDYQAGQRNRPDVGFDFSQETQGQTDFVAFQQGIRDAARRNHDAFGAGVSSITDSVLDVILPDKGGFTFTSSFQFSGESPVLGSAVTPYGEFYNVNFAKREFTIGNFSAIQAGLDVGLRPLASVDGGADVSLFFDGGSFNDSIAGGFSAIGGELAFGGSIDFEQIKTIPIDGSNPITGYSLFFGVGSPEVSLHTHIGVGKIRARSRT